MLGHSLEGIEIPNELLFVCFFFFLSSVCFFFSRDFITELQIELKKKIVYDIILALSLGSLLLADTVFLYFAQFWWLSAVDYENA